MPGERLPGIFVSWRAFRSGRRSWLGHDPASFLAVFGNGRWERSMTIRCLFALVALSSFLGATFPASALPVATAGLWSMDAAGAFILVRKGKGHGDREERFERTVATAPTGSPVFMNIRMACTGSTAIKG